VRWTRRSERDESAAGKSQSRSSELSHFHHVGLRLRKGVLILRCLVYTRKNTKNKVAEASGGRTHRRQGHLPPAGFEDRDDHRTACASGFIYSNIQTTLSHHCITVAQIQSEARNAPTGKAMGGHQTGYIFESKSGAFHVRYCATEIVDGQPRRVQKSHLLCRKTTSAPRAVQASQKQTDGFMQMGSTCRYRPIEMSVGWPCDAGSKPLSRSPVIRN
jgi:hypothetical protein